jgi:hypothetical protein
MSTPQPTPPLHDQPIPVRLKLAATWTSFMFLYAYVDILNFFTPGVVEDILDGRVFEFDLSQTFSAAALTLVAIPILMIVLSVTLPARASRGANLVAASLYVPVTAFNAVGASWLVFYGLGIVLELSLLALVLRHAWAWPRTAPTATTATKAPGGGVVEDVEGTDDEVERDGRVHAHARRGPVTSATSTRA